MKIPTPTEIRLQGLEMMMTHVLTMLAIDSSPAQSEYLKRTLIERGTKIDLSALTGPKDQAEIALSEAGLRVLVGTILLRVEETEIDVRRKSHLPEVRPVVAELLAAFDPKQVSS